MHRTRIDPGQTILLAFHKNEWAFLQNEVLFISEELEKKLRLAVMEGENLVIRLTLDDADELAGAVAAVANHCKSKQQQKQWDRIFAKVHNLLETYTDEDEPDQSFEDFLESHFPPELAHRMRETVQGKEFSSLEELNAAMSEIMMDHNRQPREDMGGLSPEQVHYLIDFDWDNPNSVIQIDADVPLEEILKTPIIHDVKAFLAGFMEEGGSVKATCTGNLNRQFIQKMVKEFRPPSEFIAWTIKHKTTLNEDDVFHIHLVRILTKIAGLIRKQKTAFKITRKGEKFSQEKHAAELYALLFEAHFRKFNLAYLDGAPPNQPLQSTIAYSFYAIGKQLLDWKKPEEEAENVVLPIVQESVYEHRHLAIQIERRILEPLARFGLLETRELPKEEKRLSPKYEYRKTAFYDKFFRFKL